MPRHLQRVGRSIRLADGQTTVEYAVMLALMIVVCLVTIVTLGEKAKTIFTDMASYWQLGFVQVEESPD